MPDYKIMSPADLLDRRTRRLVEPYDPVVEANPPKTYAARTVAAIRRHNMMRYNERPSSTDEPTNESRQRAREILEKLNGRSK